QICTPEQIPKLGLTTGLCVFSVLNSQWLAFTCRKDGQIADYSHHLLAISESYQFHLQLFE
ncbi:hypothetical protein, partial [Aeromonas veronii]|uniref:hypothetical protein n=1 Tax=Aeromonas veronii TaxID=654 RepID=UPI003BA10444